MRDDPLEPGFPKLDKVTRPWKYRRDDPTCTRKDPCAADRGARNRRSGMRKQREARKALELVTGAEAARFVGQLGNEEAWHGLPLRLEVKSGLAAKVVATKYLLCEEQSEGNHAIGDPRPFASVHMPPGWGTDGIFSCRLSQLASVVEAIANV